MAISKLHYRQKYNTTSNAWTIIVETDEEIKNRTLNFFKKLLR